MNITFICDVLGQENNGTTIATMNLIRAMRAKGHHCRIVCPDEDKKGQPDYFVLPRIYFGPLDGYVQHNGVTLAKADEEILRAAMEGADVVHCNFAGSAASHAVRLAHEMGIPVTASLHSQAENFTTHVKLARREWANKAIYRWIYHRLFSQVDAIHYPTQFVRDDFEKRLRVHTNGYVISNGVRGDFKRDPSAKKPPEYADRFVILYSARFGPEKDQKTLVKAIYKSKYKEKMQLILCGTGPFEKKIRHWGAKLPNPPDIGFHSHEEMVTMLSYADLYVHASIYDLEAISCLEALSIGLTPVLSDSKHAAIRGFALAKENLFKCRNPRDLAAKIDYWIEHPEERKANGKRYEGYASRFDFDLAMDAMERMFLETIASSHYRRDENFMATVARDEGKSH